MDMGGKVNIVGVGKNLNYLSPFEKWTENPTSVQYQGKGRTAKPVPMRKYLMAKHLEKKVKPIKKRELVGQRNSEYEGKKPSEREEVKNNCKTKKKPAPQLWEGKGEN